MLGAQAAMFVLQLAGTVVLARILTPADYGLIAMTAVVFGLAKVFRDAGLGVATVQRKSIAHDQVSTLFWVNVLVLGVIALVVAATAPLVASFYRAPQVTGITLILSAAFFVNGLSIQHDALLKRHMMFRAVAVENVTAQALNIAASIVLALAGFGYWAIVAGPCVSAVVTTGMSFWLCPWIPGRPKRGTDVRGMLRFGANVTGFNIANYLSRNLDNILVGRYLGAVQLGLYSKAYTLFTQPLQQIRGPIADVAMPVLSALKDQPERYRSYYARFVDVLAMLTVPIGAYCFVEADFLIRVLLGPSWAGVVPVFRVLALVGILQAVESTRGLVLLSQGQSRRHLNWGVANSAILAVAFVVGLPFGIIGVATGYAVASYGVLFPNLVYCFRGTPVTVGTFVRSVAPSLAAAAVASAGAWAVGALLSVGWMAEGVAATLTFGVLYVGLCALRPAARSNVARVWGVLRERIRPASVT
jgi:PST family polysaccharide transporter